MNLFYPPTTLIVTATNIKIEKKNFWKEVWSKYKKSQTVIKFIVHILSPSVADLIWISLFWKVTIFMSFLVVAVFVS